ncbi:thiol:disulfide interchange protein DsbA [Kitasatospora sp. MAP12-15]|uniref:thiol:disulfide interchange protein DsbA/DsbL n=1 Tax=unclassified Kitasatospora TaxID=2633591 RepID=UPI0024771451|nr:thiol:disulfide interchange protein DsbA/DsbL [Kitasatospora sp. MAP12-44]MDH6109079.1 thiol:disulfide interchange protein DsbA [Kitasatospora sp. MAP12-44]
MRSVQRAAVLLLSAGLTLGVATAPGAVATAPVPRDGAPYERLQHPQPVRDPAVREVVEVFWYGCYHSQLLEQPLEAWAARQPSDVVLRRLPAVWPGESDQTVERGHARLYFTLERLGEVDRLQLAVFHAVRDEGRDLTTEDGAAGWAALQGVDPQRFRTAYESDEVGRETAQAPADLARYETAELPTVVVQGTYRTGPTLAGGVEAMPAVLDDLLKQVQPAAKH